MKKINYLSSVLLSLFIIIILFDACKKNNDEEKPKDYTPVLGTDFNYTVTGNTVNFTTTLSGNVWVNNETTNVTTNFVSGACSVFIAQKGDYPFTCQTLVNGQTYKSSSFTVNIAQDDVSYLESGLWKYLSGGAGMTKTWRMDMNSDGKCVYFAGPLFYSGTEDDPYWSWDIVVEEWPYTDKDGNEHANYFNWEPDYPSNTWIMAAEDYGTITFSGNDLVATTNKFGVDESGSFTFDTTTMKMVLTGVTLPTDTSRINEGQVEEWGNIRVFSLSDSAMQLGLKRVYEGGADSKWTLVYNFVCADYNYPVPEEFTFEESINTSFTQADLVGTWKYADVPMGWIAWTKVGDQGTTFPAHLYEKWYTQDDVIATLSSWGDTSADSIFTSNSTKEYIFNGDGTCSLAGVANTYSVTDGVITFGTELTGSELNGVWINLTGTELKVIDFNKMGPETDLIDTPPFPGIWIGNQNAEKKEYQAVQLVKQ